MDFGDLEPEERLRQTKLPRGSRGDQVQHLDLPKDASDSLRLRKPVTSVCTDTSIQGGRVGKKKDLPPFGKRCSRERSTSLLQLAPKGRIA